MRRRAVVGVVLAALASAAHAAAADPPVPAGRDPGGRAVALIGRGLDYTQPHIAQRLARDGEGEIIGYDVIDKDRRPYAATEQSDIAVADLILGEGQATTLALLRADLTAWQSVAEAIALAGAMPATIITLLTPPTGEKLPALLAAASKRFADKLFIVAAGDAGHDLDARALAQPIDLPNVLIVTAVAPAANSGAKSIDVAVPVDDGGGAPTEQAAARLAALAARLLAVEPGLGAADLKTRILGLAEAWPEGSAQLTRRGLISEARRHFWLE